MSGCCFPLCCWFAELPRVFYRTVSKRGRTLQISASRVRFRFFAFDGLVPVASRQFPVCTPSVSVVFRQFLVVVLSVSGRGSVSFWCSSVSGRDPSVSVSFQSCSSVYSCDSSYESISFAVVIHQFRYSSVSVVIHQFRS